MEIANATDKRQCISRLLLSEKLPIEDLPESLENFLVAVENSEVVGVIGLEQFGNYGLLRSLAVYPTFRNSGVASKLIEQTELLAASKGLVEIYLLTETASEYFTKKGYVKIIRVDLPNEVQQSSEFSYICPQSAIAMKKKLI